MRMKPVNQPVANRDTTGKIILKFKRKKHKQKYHVRSKDKYKPQPTADFSLEEINMTRSASRRLNEWLVRELAKVDSAVPAPEDFELCNQFAAQDAAEHAEEQQMIAAGDTDYRPVNIEREHVKELQQIAADAGPIGTKTRSPFGNNKLGFIPAPNYLF